MMTSLLLLWTAASGPVAEARETEVLVPLFQSTDARTDESAAAIRLAVERSVEALPEATVMGIASVPAVGDLAAIDYSESCPPGEYVGCAFVLGEAGRVSLAVAGIVSPGEGGRVLAEVHVVDVQQSVDLISFVGDYDPLVETEVFAATVAAVVGAASRGDVKAGGDIRAAAPVVTGDRAEKQAAGRQLDQLQKEIGGSTDVGDANVGEFVREKYTTDDLASDMDTDGAKPWDRLGMSAQEYLRYKNSGMNLYEWRSRQLGRKGQVLIRGMVGYGKAPSSGYYYGREGQTSPDFVVVETYAWHSMVDTSSGRAGLEVAYGVLPELEVGLQFGWMGGRYTVDVDVVQEGQLVTPREPDELANGNVWFGGQVLYAPFPVLPVRPVVGASFTNLRGKSVASHYDLSANTTLPSFDRPNSLAVGFIPGVEARISKRVDAFLHVPLQFAIGGTTGGEQQTGGGILSNQDTSATADPLASVYAGVQAGVQVRLLGAKLDNRPSFDDPVEP
jgi:hypothetical protein